MIDMSSMFEARISRCSWGGREVKDAKNMYDVVVRPCFWSTDVSIEPIKLSKGLGFSYCSYQFIS